MDQILAIYDSEKKYVRRLAAFLEAQGRLPFRIMAFDRFDKMKKFCQNNPVRLLFISKTEWEDSLTELAEQVILMTGRKEEEQLESVPEEAFPAVCKYQSGEAIAKKLLGVCAAAEGAAIPFYSRTGSEERAETVGFYTPVGRSLQTSFALTYSRLRAAEKKTLYLNFEVFSGFEVWFEREYKTDLLDLMYFLDEAEDKFLLKLAGMTEEFGKLHYIPPAISYRDFVMIKAKEWIRLIDTIAGKSDYELVVLDLGGQMQGLFEILGFCDKIYTICKQDQLAEAKVTAFEETLRQSGGGSIMKKLKKCRFPGFGSMPQKAAELTYSQLADYIRSRQEELF